MQRPRIHWALRVAIAGVIAGGAALVGGPIGAMIAAAVAMIAGYLQHRAEASASAARERMERELEQLRYDTKPDVIATKLYRQRTYNGYE